MSTVDEVKAKLDIVEVVGEHVRLQKAGRYFKANCPFHTEKTPSFYVYPDRQSWHCFGACATGGDVISFVSRKENLDFTGALRLLAERAGVELRNDGPRRQEIKTLQDANEAAAVYFHSLLQTSERARAYVEGRGLDAKTVSEFQIGYSPPGLGQPAHPPHGPRLLRRSARGSRPAGRAGPGAGTGRPYDRFRDRLIIPIRDDRGRVAGFGGRELPGPPTGSGRAGETSQAGAKYVNTPQSPVFDKSSLLYGLDRAKDEIRRQGVAVIVEGYMDVIAAHQYGYRNVVASMGTALTDKQATLLQRFAERVVLAMDADEAGKAANLRAIQVVAAAERPHASAGTPAQPRYSRAGAAAGQGPGRADSQRGRRLGNRRGSRPAGGRPPDRRDERRPRPLAAARPLHAGYGGAAGDRGGHGPRAAGALPAAPEPSGARERGGAAPGVAPAGPSARVCKQRGSAGRSGSGARSAAGAQKEAFCLALLYASPGLRKLGLDLNENLFTLSENRELFLRWREGKPVLEDEDVLWEHYQSSAGDAHPVH